MKTVAFLVGAGVIVATGYLLFISGNVNNDQQFELPDYLDVASSTPLTSEQEKMIASYHAARQAMLENPQSIAAFADFLALDQNISREQILATDTGLNLRLEDGSSGVAMETHSDYRYLFPPYLSYDDRATLLMFRDNTMWLMEHTRSESNGEATFGYRISDINFEKGESGEYKIIVANRIGEKYDLNENDVVRERVSDADIGSDERAAGELVDLRPIPKMPTFQMHQRFVKGRDVTQNIPVEPSEGIEKIVEYYKELEQ